MFFVGCLTIHIMFPSILTRKTEGPHIFFLKMDQNGGKLLGNLTFKKQKLGILLAMGQGLVMFACRTPHFQNFG